MRLLVVLACLVGVAVAGPPGHRPDTGPPINEPRPTVRVAGFDPDEPAVRDVVVAHLLPVRRCYESYLKRDPNARGELHIEWTLSAKGTASKLTVAGFADEVAACVRRTVATWKFPSNKAGAYHAKLALVVL